MTGDCPGLDIRAARESDRPVLRAIQTATLAEPSPDLLSVALDGPAVALVAEREEPVGYVTALFAGEVAYIPELAVTPGMRRQGIGTRLIEAVQARATETGATELRLTVQVENERARAFYREHGFEIRDRLADHYETNSGDGLLLAKRL